jgi:hypothetical protein
MKLLPFSIPLLAAGVFLISLLLAAALRTTFLRAIV